jgi:hypothetical protein
MLRFYGAALKSSPLLTNMVSSTIIFTFGDVGAQLVERTEWSPLAIGATGSGTNAPIDLSRTRQQVIWASCAYTPFFFHLYRFFNRTWPGPATARTTVYRVFLSFLTAPLVNAAYFTYGALFPVVERLVLGVQLPPSSSIPDQFTAALVKAKRKIESDLLMTWKASATLWIPVNFFNFYVVPPHLSIIFTNSFSVLWSFYLSLVQFKKTPLLPPQEGDR